MKSAKVIIKLLLRSLNCLHFTVFTSLSPEYSGFTFDFLYLFVYIKAGEVKNTSPSNYRL